MSEKSTVIKVIPGPEISIKEISKKFRFTVHMVDDRAGKHMSDASQHKWIILIQKVPRGPFSESEVYKLLADGLITRSDIAFETDPENPKNSSSWKMLWQFSEFERRKEDSVDKKSEPEVERRIPDTEIDLEKKVASSLPPNLDSIKMEELVLRTKSGKISQRADEIIDVPSALLETTVSPVSHHTWLYGLGLLIVVGVFVLRGVAHWKPFNFGSVTRNLDTKLDTEFEPNVPIPQREAAESSSRSLPERSAARSSTPPPMPESRPAEPEPSRAPTEVRENRDDVVAAKDKRNRKEESDSYEDEEAESEEFDETDERKNASNTENKKKKKATENEASSEEETEPAEQEEY